MLFTEISKGTAKTGHGMCEAIHPRQSRLMSGALQLRKPPFPILVDIVIEVPGGLARTLCRRNSDSSSHVFLFLELHVAASQLDSFSKALGAWWQSGMVIREEPLLSMWRMADRYEGEAHVSLNLTCGPFIPNFPQVRGCCQHLKEKGQKGAVPRQGC